MKYLSWLNFYVLQWFFIRLAYEVREEFSAEQMASGNPLHIRPNPHPTFRYGLMIGPIPMSGYDYRPWRFLIGHRAKFIWFSKPK